MLTIAAANVNGVRAAVRRGFGEWLTARRPEVLCLQEVRAPDEALTEAIGPGWTGVHEEALAKGRAGVAVMCRTPPSRIRRGLPSGPAAGLDVAGATGRWVEADLTLDAAASGADLLTVISVYVPKGEAGTPRQEEKTRFLAAVTARLTELAADGRHVLMTGDLNIAHREIDLKNWKGNRGRSGFLPAERAWLDGLLGHGAWVDVQRSLAGEGPGPYTWWSWRGQAFDQDSGWRIDYHLASAGLAARAIKAEVDRAPTYAARWSDHAAVVVEYDLALAAPLSRSAASASSSGPSPKSPDDDAEEQQEPEHQHDAGHRSVPLTTRRRPRPRPRGRPHRAR